MRPIFLILSFVVLNYALPAVAADDDCADMLSITGAPDYKGTPPDHTLLCRTGYVLSHNTERLTPDWVLEVLTAKRFTGQGNRKGLSFKSDPDLPEGERARPADYNNQKPKKYAQGHMAPAADMKFDQEAMKESFYLSNVAPQVGPGLNSGIWSDLERLTRQWICGRGELVVISGPIYDDRPTKMGDSAVAVPSSFYKIIYDPSRKQILAFVLPNKRIDKKGEKPTEALKKYLVTVRSIEDQIGVSFLDNLSRRDRSRLRGIKPAMWSKLDEC